MKLTEEDKKEIVTNIKNAKDKRKQVEIEADLHNTSKGIIKDVLREYGFNLRILNGANLLKKEKADAPEEQARIDDWEYMAIPPVEPPVKEKVKYKKPDIIDVQDIREEPLPESSESLDDAADNPKLLKDVPADDVLFVGPHIIEDDNIIDAIGKKMHDLAERRRGLVAEVELIDVRLRKYAYFSEDLREIIESEGVEI